jgi:hypothetical protein
VICSGRYGPAMWSLRPRSLPTGFIPPCLPTGAPSSPSGDQWWHEIKHDGIRVIARKQDTRIKLYSRPGNDLAHRFPLIVEALGRLRAGRVSSMARLSRAARTASRCSSASGIGATAPPYSCTPSTSSR